MPALRAQIPQVRYADESLLADREIILAALTNDSFVLDAHTRMARTREYKALRIPEAELMADREMVAGSGRLGEVGG